MFVEIEVTQAIAWHGYDEERKPLLEPQPAGAPVRKLVAVGRIQSISADHVLVESGFGRYAYWAYAGGYEALKLRLQEATRGVVR